MYKIPISGGPHAGKTTLLEALKENFPGAFFLEEPATVVIDRELAKQQADHDYLPILPWINYHKFAPLVLEESIRLEATIPEDAGLVFMDRSLIDTIAYAELNGASEVIERTKKLVAQANYSLGFFCELVGEYTSHEGRGETVEQARQTHDLLATAYDLSGLTIVHLPAVGVEERVNLVEAAVHEHIK